MDVSEGTQKVLVISDHIYDGDFRRLRYFEPGFCRRPIYLYAFLGTPPAR